jgi:hypothetical protein
VKRAAINHQEKIMYLRARGLAYTVGIFLSAIALTAHSWAASRDLAHGMTEGPIAQMAMAEGSSAQNVPANKSRSDAGTTMKAASGDLRIKELHDQLKITPAQEHLWSAVTQVMQENEHTLETLHAVRTTRAKAMTAVDDVKSYAEIAAAHANGLQKFIPVFETLYQNMSDEQKRNADLLFGRRDPMREDSTPNSK